LSTILKISIRYIFVLLVLYSGLFATTIESPRHAIDIAGKQRMFSQRMLKDYSMIGMNNSFSNPSEDLKKTIDTFEEHLHSLDNYTKNKTIKNEISKVQKIWSPIREILESKPKKESVVKLQESLEELLHLSDDVTKLFAGEVAEHLGEIVDISGRQRMLSQRMASLYMLKVWGVNDEKFKERLDSAMKLFKRSQERLEKSELNSDRSLKLLSEVKKSFMFFEVMNRSSTKFIPTLIYRKSDDILENMDAVTKLFVVADKN